jgi:hypothetical protein
MRWPLTPRQELATVVLGCAAAAALVLYLASLTWAIEVVDRPPPLPDERREITGAALAPWLPALATAALAGAGTLLATKGRWRQVVGLLLGGVGLGIMAGAGWGVSRPETDPLWPAFAVACGLLIAAQGVLVVRRSRGWPAMGARYERAQDSHRRAQAAGGASPQGATGRADRSDGGQLSSPEKIWDALDRGEDPTT